VVIRLPTHQPPSFPSSNKQSSVVLMRLPLWVAASLTHVRTRTFLWKGLKMAQSFDTKTTSHTNVQWKHGYHILIQDVRFLLVPVAEAICATVATVTTALVVVPGVGCQTAICVIAIFYAAQTLLFLWIRPYSSTMMQVFAALTNVLTLLATIALALDIFSCSRYFPSGADVRHAVIRCISTYAVGCLGCEKWLRCLGICRRITAVVALDGGGL
ncbi:transmembrane protein, putative, partial [Bodo saltans]